MKALVMLVTVVCFACLGFSQSRLFPDDKQPPAQRPLAEGQDKPSAKDGFPVYDCLADARSIRIAPKKIDRGLEMKGKGLIETSIEYPVPLEINAEVETSGDDVRLYFGRGHIILNCEYNRKELFFADPAIGGFHHSSVRLSNGLIPVDRPVHIRWVVGEAETSLYVDGEKRFSTKGDYRGYTGRIGIGPWAKSTVIVRSLRVTLRPPATAQTKPAPALTDVSDGMRNPEASPDFSGTWQGRWQHGGTFDYTFNGKRFTSSGGASADFKVENGAVTIDHRIAAPGITHLNRFTPVGSDRLLLESWQTIEDFQSGKPAKDFGIATRAKRQ